MLRAQILGLSRRLSSKQSLSATAMQISKDPSQYQVGSHIPKEFAAFMSACHMLIHRTKSRRIPVLRALIQAPQSCHGFQVVPIVLEYHRLTNRGPK